jgi:hypothetical protein
MGDDKILALKRARLMEARQKEVSDAEGEATIGAEKKYDEDEKNSFGQKASDFANSMGLGSSIGEHLPLVGKPIADMGTKLGSTLGALTTTAPGADYMNRAQKNYNRNMDLSRQAEAEQAGYDAKSPAAQMTKGVLASLALPGPKAPEAAAIPKPRTGWDQMVQMNQSLKEGLPVTADLASAAAKTADVAKAAAPVAAKSMAGPAMDIASTVIPGMHKMQVAMKLIKNPQTLNMLKNAMMQGPRAVGITHALLMKNDPEYQQAVMHGEGQ